MGQPTLSEYLIEMGYLQKDVRRLLLLGRVKVNEHIARPPYPRIGPDDVVAVEEGGGSSLRGYTKLLKSLEQLDWSVENAICIDLGASHGGFTRLLLEKGAHRVYAVDVAYGILDYGLRNDPRVVVLERTHVKNITLQWLLPEDRDPLALLFITCDISFLSIKNVLRWVAEALRSSSRNAGGLFLIKPQFESSRSTVKGVIKDESLRQKIVNGVMEEAENLGYIVKQCVESPQRGFRGNVEFFLLWELPAKDH